MRKAIILSQFQSIFMQHAVSIQGVTSAIGF